MSRAPYLIAGIEVPLLDIIELSRDEALQLQAAGDVEISRPLSWPIPEGRPDWSSAYTDEGGTDIWGLGPYLKVPNLTEDGDTLVNRVFCPWGYPPDRIEVAPDGLAVEIAAVSLRRPSQECWYWALQLKTIT